LEDVVMKTPARAGVFYLGREDETFRNRNQTENLGRLPLNPISQVVIKKQKVQAYPTGEARPGETH
tara:strand:- start:13221 stop:13418 length:198 start_codon:yes stop_codon:yes gene_type:complete